MDLAYLTGQRPSDVLPMRKDDVEGIYLLVSQGKTGKRLRIVLEVDELADVAQPVGRCPRGRQSES
jgi:integrase